MTVADRSPSAHDVRAVLRIRIDLAYDGTDFAGWAAQPGRRTVEGELSAALGTILRADPPRLTVGGRTDAGVHARGSVCHADVGQAGWASLPARSRSVPAEAAVVRLAGVLPRDIVVRSVREVPAAFDARFSALRRRYSYRLCDHVERLDPLRRHDTVRHKRAVDVVAMDQAAAGLIGLHDFAPFCKRREGATSVRTLLDYSWAREPDGTVVGTLVADAFCRSMVRALVGAVVPVGEGRYDVGWPTRVLHAGRRHPAVTVMPAHGLCLEEISYPAEAELGSRAQEARAVRKSG
jgi:tRNA pseudouridine38-40 synthase